MTDQLEGRQVVPHTNGECPPEWAALLQAADQRLGGVPEILPIKSHDASAIILEADRLSDARLERARYFALGQALCGYARHIYDPVVRAKIVNDYASRITEFQRAFDEGRSFSPMFIQAFAPKNEFDGAIEAGLVGMGPAGWLALDALMTVANYRLQFQQGPEAIAMMGSSPNESENITRVQNRTPARSLLVSAATGASLILLRRLIVGWRMPQSETVDLQAPVTAQELEIAGLSKYARGNASTRIDEFLNDQTIGSLTEFSGSDSRNVTFKWGQITSVPGLRAPNRATLHAERLTCPALRVKNLIPYTIELTREILVTAIKQLEDAQA